MTLPTTPTPFSESTQLGRCESTAPLCEGSYDLVSEESPLLVLVLLVGALGPSRSDRVIERIRVMTKATPRLVAFLVAAQMPRSRTRNWRMPRTTTPESPNHGEDPAVTVAQEWVFVSRDCTVAITRRPSWCHGLRCEDRPANRRRFRLGGTADVQTLEAAPRYPAPSRREARQAAESAVASSRVPQAPLIRRR